MMMGTLLLLTSVVGMGVVEGIEQFPVAGVADMRASVGDWLVNGEVQPTRIHRSSDGRYLFLTNGMVSRRFRMTPNAATVGLDDLRTHKALLRAVKPEAQDQASSVSFSDGCRDLSLLCGPVSTR